MHGENCLPMLTEWQRDENVYMHEVACACGTASVNEWTVECSISVFYFILLVRVPRRVGGGEGRA